MLELQHACRQLQQDQKGTAIVTKILPTSESTDFEFGGAECIPLVVHPKLHCRPLQQVV
jgi:hypothetical protein